MPISGLEDEIVVVVQGSEDALPVAHTCSMRLDLPPYRSKEQLQRGLDMGIEHGQGSFAVH
jgi:hypothetical protein